MAGWRRNKKFDFPVTSLAGSSAPNFYRLAGDHRIFSGYRIKFIFSFLISLILEPFRGWERLRWKRRLSKVSIDSPPIFIIGFWRSGTTLLHNLMCQAPGAAYVTTFQTVFPHVVLSHSWWLKHLVNIFLPEKRPFDNVLMDMDFPQEEEIAMAHIQALSFYNFWYFPADFEYFSEHDLFFENADQRTLKKWKKEYLLLIKKAMVNTGGRQFISKSPPNLGRVGTLLEMFPDARFIFTYRNPYRAMESFYLFAREIFPGVQLQNIDMAKTREPFAKLFNSMIRKYEKDKHLIPAGHLIEIKFDDFILDKKVNLKKIYEDLSLPGWEEAEKAFDRFLPTIANHKKAKYEITGETVRLVNKYMKDLVIRWGYDVME